MSEFIAPEAHPVTFFPSLADAEDIRRLFGKLPARLQRYLGVQFAVGLTLLDDLRRGAAAGEESAVLKIRHEQTDRLFELKSFFAEAASSYSIENESAGELEKLRRDAEAALYPNGLSSDARVIHFALLELEGEISEILTAGHLFEGLREEANIRERLPNAADASVRRFASVHAEIRRLLEFISFSFASDAEPDFGPEPEEDETTEEVLPKPVQLREMTAAVRKLSRPTRAQFAWLHNRLCAVALSAVGGRLSELAAALQKGGADDEEEKAVIRQYKEAVLGRTVFAKDAKRFDADAVEPQDARFAFDDLANAMAKPAGSPLRRALTLITIGLCYAREMDPVALRDAMADDENVPYADWIALCGAVAAAGVIPSASDSVTTFNVGAIDPRTVKIPGFRPEAVWKQLTCRLSREHSHRLAHYMKNMILLYDEVVRCKPAEIWLENDWIQTAAGNFEETAEYVKPLRAVLLPALADAAADGSETGSVPLPQRFLPGSAALFTELAESVVLALEDWSTADEKNAVRLAEALMFIGAFGVKCQAMTAEIGECLPEGLRKALEFGPLLFSVQALAHVSGTLSARAEE